MMRRRSVAVAVLLLDQSIIQLAAVGRTINIEAVEPGQGLAGNLAGIQETFVQETTPFLYSISAAVFFTWCESFKGLENM